MSIWQCKFHVLIAVSSVFISQAAAQDLAILSSDLGNKLEVVDNLQESSSDTLGFSVTRSTTLGISPATARKRLSAVNSYTSPVTRGAREARLYAALSPRVVMVVTNDGLGSGAVIADDGSIITNWHVIEDYEVVGVIYKPIEEGREPTEADVHLATVVRFDEVADLALLKVDHPPSDRTYIVLGTMTDIPVGSDVHAIGHPTGESWTYTKGIVSQVRKGYEWVTESGKVHIADVIQTQTPINPGNSGGPLLSDSYELVGVNSFVAQGEGLNFAVSVDEVRKFIASSSNRYADSSGSSSSTSDSTECDSEMGSIRNDENTADITYFDFDCDGNADGYATAPDDMTEPMLLSMDTTGDGSIDTVYGDLDRDGQVDRSAYDTTGDGNLDLLGYHQNGDTDPYRYESIDG